ncbi:tryptophan synthase subunit alpha [Desulfobacterales bacterium HSG16]|nr:tryptophan synthase subunit alpha [Desulfobacterales bacterium HSG16]
MLESYIKKRLAKKDILLMTHIVIGYPSLEDSLAMVKAMVEEGVDLMELQIPFSEPIADGPVILHANQESLARGTSVKKCLDFAEEVTSSFDIPFLFMTYYNILFKYGVDRFAEQMRTKNIKGAIVPDLPPEEGKDYIDAMKQNDLAPIYIFSPTTPKERMDYLASFGRGFIYCVARKGVTGLDTSFSDQLGTYLAQCREATSLPLALGFGVKDKDDVDFLKGKADIAVIGTQTIRLMEKDGIGAVRDFIANLNEGL